MKAKAGVTAASHATSPESRQRRRMRDLRAFNKGCSMQLAFGFGPIDAQRIEFRDLMQETLLWRNRDYHASVDQQDWLAKLQVPIPQRQPLALESCNGKIRPLEKVEQ